MVNNLTIFYFEPKIWIHMQLFLKVRYKSPLVYARERKLSTQNLGRAPTDALSNLAFPPPPLLCFNPSFLPDTSSSQFSEFHPLSIWRNPNQTDRHSFLPVHSLASQIPCFILESNFECCVSVCLCFAL